jgi:hypothetical protein
MLGKKKNEGDKKTQDQIDENAKEKAQEKDTMRTQQNEQITKEASEPISQEDEVKPQKEGKEDAGISHEPTLTGEGDSEGIKANEKKTPSFKKTMPSMPSNLKKLPMLPLIVIAVVIIIIIALATSGILGGGDDSKKSGGENELYEEPMSWEDVVTITGSISGGGPMTYMPDERVPFDVENTVVKLDITLTWNPQSQDLDLAIEDPEGRERGASGNAPGEPESVSIKKNIQAGTWTAIIDPFAAFGVDYTLEIIYSHETGNTTGEGILYQKTESLSGESDEQSDEFDVEDEYESLIIKITLSSTEGSMTIEVSNPDGDVVYSQEISGEDEVVDESTVDTASGTWNVHYTFDGFTGDIEVNVMGS